MLIGTLERIDIKSVLQRIETHSKTGQLIVRQEKQWLEMYFRDGHLMCVGPVQMYGNLGERLCQTGVISVLILQEALQILGTTQPSETRMALTLMDLGYVKNEELRVWATHSFSEVLQQLLSWSTGQVSFEEHATPPTDRLLVALSVSSLLTSLDGATVSSAQPTQATIIEQPTIATTAIESPSAKLLKAPFPQYVSSAPTLVEMSQFMTGYNHSAASDARSVRLPEFVNAHGTLSASALLAPTATTASTPEPNNPLLNFLSDVVEEQPLQAQTLAKIVKAHRVDTKFMQPDMLLMPRDISGLYDQNTQIELTPEQWRVLTLVDGTVSLKHACQVLMMHPDILCQIAGELLSLGLISVDYMYEASVSQEALQQQSSAAQVPLMNVNTSLPLIQGHPLQPHYPLTMNRPMAMA